MSHEERYVIRAPGGASATSVQGPDGLIYLLTDSSQGRILRLRPAEARS